jgi:O-antigen/teichoic acid export membrane protein
LKRRRRTSPRQVWEQHVSRSPMAGSIATGIAGQVVLVASGIVVARALGPENRGVLALVVVISAIATQVGSLGVPVSVTYWIATEQWNPRSLLRGLRRFRNMQLGAILAAQAVLILVVLEPRSPSGFLGVAFLSLVATASGLSQMYGLAVLQGLRRFRAFNALRILNGALYVGGVVALWGVSRATLTSITLAVIGASVVAALATWGVVLRLTAPAQDWSEVETPRIVSFGLRSLFGSSPPIETFRLDQLLIGLVLPPLALGYYIVALAFTNLSRFVGQSIGMVTYPRVAATADGDSRLRILRRDFVLGVVVCGMLTLILVAVVPWLLPLFFGSEFEPARSAARILLIATFFAAIRRILVDGTRGAGWPMWGATAELLTLLALPAVVIVAHFTNSITGVALVVAVANFVGLLAIAPALLGVAFNPGTSRWSPTQQARGISSTKRQKYVHIASRFAGVLCISLAISGAGILAAAWSPSTDEVLIALTAAVLVAGLVVKRSATGRLDIFEPLTLFVLAWGVMFVARPIAMLASHEFTILTYDISSGFTEMLVLALVGALAFVIAYLSGIGGKVASRLRPLPSLGAIDTAVSFAACLVLLGLGLFALFIKQAGGSAVLVNLLTGRRGGEERYFLATSAYVYSAVALVVPAALLLIEAALRRSDKVLLACGLAALLPMVVIAGTTGTRSSLLPVVLAVGALVYLRKDSRPKAWAVLVFVFFIFTIGISFFGNARNADPSGKRRAWSVLAESVTRPDRAMSSTLQSGDTEMAPLMALLVSKVPSDLPYFDGRATGELLVHWVPRALWHAKPRQGDEVFTRRLIIDRRISAAPRQYSPLANFYLDFGVVGVMVGMALLGVLGRTHYEYFSRHRRHSSTQLFYAASFPFWIVLLRGNITDTAGRLLFVLPPLLLGLWVARARSHRNVVVATTASPVGN